MSNEGHSWLKDSELYRLFRQCKLLNAMPLVHAENGALIQEVVSFTYLLYSRTSDNNNEFLWQSSATIRQPSKEHLQFLPNWTSATPIQLTWF